MVTVIRAVYRNGQVVLPDDVQFEEGQEFDLVVREEEKDDEEERMRRVYEKLNVRPPQKVNMGENFDEDAVRERVRQAFKGVTLSDLIIEERRTGP